MYDMNMKTYKERSAYRKFRKKLLSKGCYMLQESIYLKQLSNKEQAKTFITDLNLSAPEKANIRGLLLTQRVFETMDIISGEAKFAEKVLKKANPIVEI